MSDIGSAGPFLRRSPRNFTQKVSCNTQTPSPPDTKRIKSGESTSLTSTQGLGYDKLKFPRTHIPAASVSPTLTPPLKFSSFSEVNYEVAAESPTTRKEKFLDRKWDSLNSEPGGGSEQTTPSGQIHSSNNSSASSLELQTIIGSQGSTPQVTNMDANTSLTPDSSSKIGILNEEHIIAISPMQLGDKAADTAKTTTGLHSETAPTSETTPTSVTPALPQVAISEDVKTMKSPETEAEIISELEKNSLLEETSKGAKQPSLPSAEVPKKSEVYSLDLIPFGEKKDLDVLNHDIYSYIVKRRVAKPKHSTDKGWVYVFDSPENAVGHVKIGFTKSHPLERKKIIEDACKIKLRLVKDETFNALLHHEYLERLVHLALHAERKKYREKCTKCSRKNVHQEWFLISPEKALMEIELWKNWIVKRKPFDADGTLTEYWYWRARKLRSSFGTICWEEWTQPGGLDGTDPQDYDQFCKERWQVRLEFRWHMANDFFVDQLCKARAHMGRKDERFWSRGRALLLLVAWHYDLWTMCFALVVLCAL